MSETPEKTDGYHYARGTFRRLAETEYHQPKQERLRDYWHRPTGEEVVEAMVEKGWAEDVARNAVRRLWKDQMAITRENAGE